MVSVSCTLKPFCCGNGLCELYSKTTKISTDGVIDVNYSPPSVVDWAVSLIRRGDFVGICDRRIGAPNLNPTVASRIELIKEKEVESFYVHILILRSTLVYCLSLKNNFENEK